MHRTLFDQTAATAAESPGAVALVGPRGATTTHGELFERTQELARALTALGVERGDRVALLARGGPETAIAFLGSACVATVAPLDPTLRARELDGLFAKLSPRVLVAPEVDSPAVARAEARGIPVLHLVGAGSDARPTPGAPRAAGFEPPRPEDGALILHTSGSTGTPKLVALTHANLCASNQEFVEALGLTPDDRCLDAMPLFHVHGIVPGALAPLAAGGSVICPRGFDLTRFLGWMRDHRPTWYTSAPSIHRGVVSLVRSFRPDLSEVPLRFVRSAASKLPRRVHDALEELLGVPVVEGYGMSEAPLICASSLDARKPGSVGRPVGNEVTVRDAAGQPAADGRRGEVTIRGPGVFEGYADDPAANEACFVDGWFRTGDEGYLDEEGFLFLTGRFKELVDVGGEKVSPQEVEGALLEHPAVAEAVAFPLPHELLGEQVAAAVVLEKGADVTEDDLRDHAARLLAAIKVPRRLWIVDALPKGRTNKVQRSVVAAQLGAGERP